MIRRCLIVSGCLLSLGLATARGQAPGTDFSANPTAGCGPLTVTFTDLSSNSPTTWNWDFGNGQTSTRQNPTATYSTPGTYTVTLIARNGSGANAMRKTDYITVYPFPSPQFTSNLTLACAPASVQFTDGSTPGQGSISSWLWNFGDGATSNAQNPSHTYTQTGYFNVSLTVTNSGGCSNSLSVTRYMRIVNGIQPNFAFSQSSVACAAPFTGQLLNQSAGPGNLSFSWTLDNGAIPANSTDTSPRVTFPVGGSYDVTIQVSSSLGCTATLKKTLPFSNTNAVITGPDTVCVNTPTAYSNGSSPTPPATRWDFGDGSGANTANTSKTWPATGSYTLKMVNQYSSCSDSATQTVQVVNPAVPAFTSSSDSACKPNLTVNFTDQSTGNPRSWLWDFGDGSTSTQQNPSHTYISPGSFNVKLTVSNAGSCSDTLTKTAFVVIQAPTVTIDGILAACTSSTPHGAVIEPVANVTAVDAVTGYAWSAPGSNEGTSTAANPVFTYPSVGNYTLSVTVTTAGGCTATGSASVEIGTPLAPSFTFTPNSPICSRSTVTFHSTTPNANNWTWNFGDHSGTVFYGDSVVTHSYQFYGPHTVTLTVINNGCAQQATEPIDITPPFAHFTDSLGTDCANKFLVGFRDTSFIYPLVYGPASYSWDFGDPASPANTSTLQNPQHQFTPGPAPQTFNVKLVVTEAGCKDSITNVVTLGVVNPAFTPPTTACRNTAVSFTSSSTPASLIGTYSWQADAGAFTTPSDTPSFQASFTSNGTHSVTLTVTDIYNCTYTATQNIQITGPTASFTAPAGGCLDAAIPFTDASTPYGANTITTWSWNFGDSSTSAVQSPTHPYADTGQYSPYLTVTDNAGCSDTFHLPIQIASPTASFFGPDSFYCAGVPLPFIDSSKGYGLAESWNYGDGSPTQNQPFGAPSVHTFPTSGTTYNVQLTVTDKYGCTNTVTNPVRIQNPIAAFTIADTTAICWPLQTFFLAHGQYYDSLYWNFGDGTTSTLDSTSHFYNDYGLDSAKLFLQGPGGCLDSVARLVRVINPYATTSLTYGPPTKACDSLFVLFDVTPPPYSLFTLSFGDLAADSSQNRNPSHLYRNPTTYGPSLSLTDPTGCIVNIGGSSGVITILGSTPFFSVNKKAFCDSGTVNFTDFSFSNDGMTSETYNFGDGSAPQTQTPGSGSFNTSHLYDQPGNFFATLKVTTNSGCNETYTDTIDIYPIPQPAIAFSGTPCDGYIHFQGSAGAQTDSVTWNWDFGGNQHSNIQNPIVRMTPGTYLVTLQVTVPPLGCTDTTSSPITIHPLPVVKGPAEISTPVGFPIAIPFTYGPGIVTYSWTPPANLDCPTCPNPSATLLFSQEYTVTVTDQYGCTTADSILIKTICNEKNYFLPNTFSPNGDGVNDYFFPRGSSLYNIQSLTVFNRWGQMVFQRRDFPPNTPSMGWDGTFNGRPAPADAYVYIVEVICDNAQVIALHGNVTLIR